MNQNTFNKRLLNSGILPKWHDKSLEDFTNDEEAKQKVITAVSKHKEMSQEGVGVYLYGANGTGKSMLMNTAFKQLLQKGYRVRIMTLGTLVSRYTASWYDEEEHRQFKILMQKTHFVGIEEIGKEYRSDTSNLAVTALDNFLRVRLQMNLPTWFCSNLSPSQIETLYTPDIASMLKEMTVILRVSGEDFRDAIHNQNKSKFL